MKVEMKVVIFTEILSSLVLNSEKIKLDKSRQALNLIVRVLLSIVKPSIRFPKLEFKLLKAK